MKDWSEYETDVEYFPSIEIRREMRREIDGLALTKDERERRLRELPALVSAEYERRNAEWKADKDRLLGQFWDDLRADLGYGVFLNETAECLKCTLRRRSCVTLRGRLWLGRRLTETKNEITD